MDLEEVTTFQSILRLESKLENKDDLLLFLISNGLLRHQGTQCCNRSMTEDVNEEEKHLGMEWRCTVCRNSISAIQGSFFEGSQLHPFTIIKIAFAYVAMGLTGKTIRMTIDDVPAARALADWMQYLRDVLSKDLMAELQNKKMGGPGQTVVVDVTALEKPKKKREGEPVVSENMLILAIYDLEHNVGVLEWIPSLSHRDVVPKIEHHVEQGTEIRTGTGKLGAGLGLGKKGFKHESVNHSHSFVAGNRVHMNHVKGYFSRLKAFIQKKNVKSERLLLSIVEEFMWRERHSNCWKDFLTALRKQYCGGAYLQAGEE